MKRLMKNVPNAPVVLFAVGALLLFVGLACSGCESTQEAADDSATLASCQDYCDKRFDCDDYQADSSEIDACVNVCRDSIEDGCGNNRQSDANDIIDDCVDRNCVDFLECMVFEDAPNCFNFVNTISDQPPPS
jgi:hypothetical protein